MAAAEYLEDDEGASSFHRWLLPALVLSVALHIAFFVWLSQVPVARSDQAVYDKMVPRLFRIDRVEIDQKLLEPEPAPKQRPAMAPDAVKIPDDRVSFEKLMADTKGEPAAPKIDQKILSEKPSPASPTLQQTTDAVRFSGAQSVLEDSKAIQQALLDEKPGAGSAAVSDLLQPDSLTGRAIAKSGPASGRDKPGFSNLDDLLAQTGPLSPETAPILMPTDLLFAYDKADLQPQAVASLEKLGTLIQRNPQATFKIEGHTDSFGTDEYNMALSQRRADEVKAWLVTAMKIPTERITTQGYGKTRLIAPAKGSIEEQQINRRVEIVIRTPQ